MNNDFSKLNLGNLVAVRRQFLPGILIEGERYWFFAARVQRRHRNGQLTVIFDDLAGKQVAVRFDQQGYPVGPGGTAERQDYEAHGGLLVPVTPAIRRIFRHQQTLSAIWKLTWPDLLLLRNYELDLINMLLQEAKARSAAKKNAAGHTPPMHSEMPNWLLCLKGDGHWLLEHFPLRKGDRLSVEEQSVERDGLTYVALSISFAPVDERFSDEQLAFLSAFGHYTTIFAMSEQLCRVCEQSAAGENP